MRPATCSPSSSSCTTRSAAARPAASAATTSARPTAPAFSACGSRCRTRSRRPPAAVPHPSTAETTARDGRVWRVESRARRRISRANPGPIGWIGVGFFDRNRKELEERGIDPARLPPGQYFTDRFPVLHAGSVPEYPAGLAGWDFSIAGLVEAPVTLTWDELLALPSAEVVTDIHCV